MDQSGSIGAAIANSIGEKHSKKVRKSKNFGSLHYGPVVLVLSLICLIIVGLALRGLSLGDVTLNQFLGFLLIFGLGGIYCFGEFFKVKGTFNYDSIDFHSPWTGRKVEMWDDLISVKFIPGVNWYLLVFNSGKKIRISNLITGHGDVINLVKHKALNF